MVKVSPEHFYIIIRVNLSPKFEVSVNSFEWSDNRHLSILSIASAFKSGSPWASSCKMVAIHESTYVVTLDNFTPLLLTNRLSEFRSECHYYFILRKLHRNNSHFMERRIQTELWSNKQYHRSDRKYFYDHYRMAPNETNDMWFCVSTQWIAWVVINNSNFVLIAWTQYSSVENVLKCVNVSIKGDDQIAIILDDVSKVETIQHKHTFWLPFLLFIIVTHYIWTLFFVRPEFFH